MRPVNSTGWLCANERGLGFTMPAGVVGNMSAKDAALVRTCAVEDSGRESPASALGKNSLPVGYTFFLPVRGSGVGLLSANDERLGGAA